MKAPPTYYQTLKEKLKGSKVKIIEDMDLVRYKYTKNTLLLFEW